jgi:hypothetical protein
MEPKNRTQKVLIRPSQGPFGDTDIRSIIDSWLAPEIARHILVDHVPGPSTRKRSKRGRLASDTSK